VQGIFVSQEKIFIGQGKRIAELRASMSQAEFATRLGVDRKTVVRWEAGERLPDGISLLHLVTEFAADVNYILTGQRAHAAPTLDASEAVLLDTYKRCPPQGRAHLIQTAALLSAGLPTSQTHATAQPFTQTASGGGNTIQVGGSIQNSSVGGNNAKPRTSEQRLSTASGGRHKRG
jgi:transcriptional regulator with XRE-family HTH domain